MKTRTLKVQHSPIANPKKRAMLLSALYLAQEQFGWLSPEALQRVADRLELTPGQVYAAASFYSMFKLEPYGRFHIQVCEGLSCYLMGGAEPVLEHLEKRLASVSVDARIQAGETAAAGATAPASESPRFFSLEVVQCLAACDVAPAIKVNDQLYGNLTLDKLDALIDKLIGQVSTSEQGSQAAASVLGEDDV
jgi:NADH-quinone oxidoreductase subunit E